MHNPHRKRTLIQQGICLEKGMTIPAQVDELLAQMTPAEKAGQLTQYSYFGPPEGTEQVEGSRLGIPLLIGFDVIHGLRTIFPVPIAMAASWDPRSSTSGSAPTPPRP